MAGAHLLGQADGARDIDAGGAAQAEAFMLEKIEDDRDGFAVRNLKGVVETAPSIFLVTRPWPMPSVMEEPSAFSSPVL